MTAKKPINDSAAAKELSRRRVTIFLSIFLIVWLCYYFFEERVTFLDFLDELIILAISIALLVIIGTQWDKRSPSELRRQHKATIALLLVAFAVELLAFPVELLYVSHFSDEVPNLILIGLEILNAFV